MSVFTFNKACQLGWPFYAVKLGCFVVDFSGQTIEFRKKDSVHWACFCPCNHRRHRLNTKAFYLGHQCAEVLVKKSYLSLCLPEKNAFKIRLHCFEEIKSL